MNFDRKYLDQEHFVKARAARDQALRDLGVDPEEYKVWSRNQNVGNETNSDEYRETQPAKGLHMISDFLDDYRAGWEVSNEVIRLTHQWLGVVDDAHTRQGVWNKKIGWYVYGGAEELAPILTICFDFLWEEGGISLYQAINWLPEEADVEYFFEDKASREAGGSG